MGHDDARIVLEGVEVMAGKTFAFLAGDEERAGLTHQGLDGGGGQRLFFVERFVHGDDELGHGMQPCKPGIAGQQAQEMVGRLNGADGFFVSDALGFDQCFVQGEQSVADLLEAFVRGGFHVACNVSHLKAGCKPRYAEPMRMAFKEWAVVVDALGRGGQIVLLRKGGLREGRGGFQVEQTEFLLFPTLFHQQRESVIPAAQLRYDEIAPHLPGAGVLRVEFFCRLADWRLLATLQEAEELRGQHIWRDEVIAERFDWGRSKQIHALAVRVFRLEKPVERPMSPAFGGCKSWVDLEREIDIAGARSVLTDEAFAQKLAEFQKPQWKTLGGAAKPRF